MGWVEVPGVQAAQTAGGDLVIGSLRVKAGIYSYETYGRTMCLCRSRSTKVLHILTGWSRRHRNV